MDPGSLIDVASQLRGIGVQATKSNTVRAWPQCAHQRPEFITQPWLSAHAERPKAGRNPALGADYVVDGVRPSAPGVLTNSVVDIRSATEIVGTSTRGDARRDIISRR